MRRRLDTTFQTLSRSRGPIYRVSIEWDGNSDYPVKIGRYENGRIDKPARLRYATRMALG